jgi:hypothetical protein
VHYSSPVSDQPNFSEDGLLREKKVKAARNSGFLYALANAKDNIPVIRVGYQADENRAVSEVEWKREKGTEGWESKTVYLDGRK